MSFRHGAGLTCQPVGLQRVRSLAGSTGGIQAVDKLGLKFRGLVESRTVIVWLQLVTGSAFAVGSTSNATSMEPAFQLCSCGAPPLPTLPSGIGAVTASCVRNLATRVRRGTVHLARSIRTRLCGARTGVLRSSNDQTGCPASTMRPLAANAACALKK